MAHLFPQIAFFRCNFNLYTPRKIEGHSCARRCYKNNKVLQTQSQVPVYQKTSWSHDFIQGLVVENSINNKEKVEKLQEKVILMLNKYENGGSSILQLLELIDDIERLGLGYRFHTSINNALKKVSLINETKEEEKNDDLHMVCLKFRLLRQHGYIVSPGFLKSLKDNHGGLIQGQDIDVKALVSIYEASYLAIDGELDLQEAKLFSTENLVKLCGHENKVTEDQIRYALNTPLYRRMHRLQARWYIDAYSKRTDANPNLLHLAKLDFNMVQSIHKRDLQEVSKWWRDIGMATKLSFIRDRLMECLFWVVGLVFEPQYGSVRVDLTKVCALVTTIDDIYDIYGSVDELEVFTNAVKRWDINAVEHMPWYLKVGFMVLYNTINQMGCKSLNTQGRNIVPTLAKVWGELCEAFYVEAKWTQSGYMPTLEDYLDNAWRSVSGVVILTHCYLSMNQDIKTDPMDSLQKCHDLFKWSSMLFRLYNDLATSADEMDRGKSANAISCYMHENGVCEEVAREHINTLIEKTWMKLIEARVSYSKDFTDPFVDVAVNLARVSHCTYQYGDGHGAPDARARDRVLSVIIDPIPVENEQLTLEID